MRILINTPCLKLPGGVANHYLGLKDYWKERVRYNTVGKRTTKAGSGRYWLPWDVLKFVFRLITFRPDVVVVNPSLFKSALVRDFIFLNIARMFKRRCVVFMHGFDPNQAAALNHKHIADNLNKAAMVMVLGDDIRKQLVSWGVTVPIHLTTTKVDDRIVRHFVPNEKLTVRNLLFLARIEKDKGIYEAIDTFALLKSTFPDLKLNVVGDGSQLTAAKAYVTAKGISDVVFKGYVTPDHIADEYRANDIYLFPSYTEGMPTSVLEAMAFALPVVTHRVGGLPDFFVDGKMGFITDSLSDETYARLCTIIINDISLYNSMASCAYEYAHEHFLASKVAQNIEQALSNI